MAGTVPPRDNLTRVSDTRTAPAITLWVAIGALAVEALGALAGAVLLAVAALTGPSMSAGSAISTIVVAVLLAVVFAALARLLARRTRGARGPALVLQLLLIPIGWYMSSGGTPWVGIPLLVIAVLGAVALLAPGTRAELGIGPDEQG
jgi:uncharacterized membrane protein YhaH (DUF805 family)